MPAFVWADFVSTFVALLTQPEMVAVGAAWALVLVVLIAVRIDQRDARDEEQEAPFGRVRRFDRRDRIEW